MAPSALSFSLFPCTCFLIRVVACTRQYLRLTRWSALVVEIVGTTIGMLLCLHRWLWIVMWLPLLFSLQQRKFLQFYLSYKISECGVLSLRLLLSFCPSFTIFTFLCFGFFRYIDNMDDFISHWDTFKRFDVFEIFELVSFSAYRLYFFSPGLFSVEFFSMLCDIFYSIFWMRACLNVRGKTLCVW